MRMGVPLSTNSNFKIQISKKKNSNQFFFVFLLQTTMPLNYEGQCYLFDVTVHDRHAHYASFRELIPILNSIAKKWCFQQEKGDSTERIHWQVRLSLHKPKRCGELLSQIAPKFPGHWSVTSSTVHDSTRVFNYTMKVDTRIDGPWTEKDTPADPPPRTRMVAAMDSHWEQNSFYPYQKYIYDECFNYNCRYIDVILDTRGHIGKSAFCEWLEYQQRACEVPPIRDMQDLVAFIIDQPVSQAYLIDMPRGMKKDKLAEFYAGVETVKNGFLYDKRYKGRKKRIERPRIFIFTNTMPVLSLLSTDRWKVWQVDDVEAPLTLASADEPQDDESVP